MGYASFTQYNTATIAGCYLGRGVATQSLSPDRAGPSQVTTPLSTEWLGKNKRIVTGRIPFFRLS